MHGDLTGNILYIKPYSTGLQPVVHETHLAIVLFAGGSQLLVAADTIVH